MTFLELPHAELDPQFGPRFLYQAYKTIVKSLKRPDNMVLMTRTEHQRLLKEAVDAKLLCERLKMESEQAIAALTQDFTTLLEASAGVQNEAKTDPIVAKEPAARHEGK
jgi:hypothetical protein